MQLSPNSVKLIDKQAFYNCSKLESITIPDGVIFIDEQAFYNCSSLESITIPSNMGSIRKMAFYGCSSLESITIPNSTVYIGERAFYGCSSLESITIHDGMISIGYEAFKNCSSLESITVYRDETSLCELLNYDHSYPSVFPPSVKKLFIYNYEIDIPYGEYWLPNIIEIINMIISKEYSIMRAMLYFDMSISTNCVIRYNNSEEYLMNTHSRIKNGIILQIFLQNSQPEDENYIKENLEEIIKDFITENDYNNLTSCASKNINQKTRCLIQAKGC